MPCPPAMKIARALIWSTLLGTAAGSAVAATPGTDNVTAPQRPQISATQATEHTAAHYLADGPAPWAPAAVDTHALKPDFIVAADGSGTHRTVQAAVDAVPAAAAASGNARRWVIQIRPGSYREPLCVSAKAPLTLIGVPGDAGAVRLVKAATTRSPSPPAPRRTPAGPTWRPPPTAPTAVPAWCSRATSSPPPTSPSPTTRWTA